MSKKIVFCADGTWNQPHSPAIVEGNDTNVYKLFNCLARTSTQASNYDSGVGTGESLVQHLIAGAFGDGLLQKVKDGYTAIAKDYQPGDAIYIFGFSRGAYTARCLAGMVAICGLPTKGFDDNLLATAFQAYRDKAQRAALLASLTKYALFDAKITCLGVWDTVGELGIPLDPLGLNNARYGFLDTSLHPDVQNAFHAVSIDEKRREFPPTLWTPPFTQTQHVEQAWFSGVHCDVGGGYNETGLSDVTLGWMLSKAMASDPANQIEIIDAAARPYLKLDDKKAVDTIHESWSLLWGPSRLRSVPQDAAISNSVQIRILQDGTYRPQNLQLAGNRLAQNYAIQNVIAEPTLAVAVGQ
jgi:uncharacterized protein (DUF2235 family)